jgi:hypothetical protein
MATEYNPYNGSFGSKQQMENYEWAKSCKPSQSMLHGVECAKNQRPQQSFFVRTVGVPKNQDQRMYDLGTFQVAATGMQSNGAACGELWCSYEIELRKPRIQVGVAGNDDGNSNFDHFQQGTGTDISLTNLNPSIPFNNSTTTLLFPVPLATLGGCLSGGIVPASACAASPNTPSKNNFAGGVAVLAGGLPTGALGPTTANTYYFPPGTSQGNFMVQYNAAYGTSGVAWAPTLVPTNCGLIPLMNASTVSQQSNTAGVSTTTTIGTFFLQIIRANASFQLTGFQSSYAGASQVDVYVVQIPLPVT